MQPAMSPADVSAIIDAQRRQKQNLEDQIGALTDISQELSTREDVLALAIARFASAWSASVRENLVGLEFQIANNEAVLQAMSSNILVPGLGAVRRKQPS